MSNDKYKYDILYNSSTKTIQSFRFNILLKSDMNDNEIVKCANELRSTALSQKLLLSKYFLADDFSDNSDMIIDIDNLIAIIAKNMRQNPSKKKRKKRKKFIYDHKPRDFFTLELNEIIVGHL